MTSHVNNTALLNKTRPYAQELPFVSYWTVSSTFGLLSIAIALSILANSIWLKLLLALPIGLLVMRCFILFHDYQHKAILSRSIWAPYFFGFFGLLVFTPANIWRQSHNFHHAHNTILETSHIGSFWTASVAQWYSMSPLKKFKYSLCRHPLTMVLGVFTVFIYDHCIHSFARNPFRNWTGLLSPLLHLSIATVAFYYDWFATYLLAVLLPLAIAGCLASYLFYAQHNFPDTQLLSRQNWTYTEAALGASCFIKMSALMHWFSGNIAYHHVHHLNHRIPFYRLPEAMAAIEELRSPKTTSLHWRDIITCLRLQLWDEEQNKMVSINSLKNSVGNKAVKLG